MGDFIKRYVFGKPMETGALLEKDKETVKVQDDMPKEWVVSGDTREMWIPLEEKTMVYGLGETVRGINKRGWIYISNNSDEPRHEEGKRSLYASQNFLLLDRGSTCIGYFIDYPGKLTFDIGYSQAEELRLEFEDFDFDFYEIQGETPVEIVHRFRELIGRSYIPPIWAFGFGQSRWGYKNQEDIRKVEESYAKAEIPLDMIYMDIDYMQDFKDFTVNPERFPQFPTFVSEMKEKGIRLIPIIDAGVKMEKGYDIYEEGVKADYFCKKEDGTDLVAAVWPGKVHFPDFLNEEAAKWFGDQYQILTDMGIEGFWNDMNEPAIFYTEEHLKEVFRDIKEMEKQELDIWGFFQFKGLVETISNNAEDYKRFYHQFHGMRVRHDKVHNLYGFYMTKSAGEAFARNCPDKRILLFSRSSYTGMHRYGGIWTGDNTSWWSHLLLNVKQMPSLSMTGFLYSGADIGGFGSDTTEDLVLRWIAFGIFTPLFRNHSALGTREQELYQFERIQDFKKIVELRYAFLPYLYSEFMKAATKYEMYMKPMAFDYREDERCKEIEDQILLGESLMLAPVYEQNKTGRYVYLPERMKFLKFRSIEDYDEEILEAGDHYISVALNEVPVFLREGHVLPYTTPKRHVQELDFHALKYFSFGGSPEEYEYYMDDGVTPVK